MSKTISRKHLNITEPGTSKRKYKNKSVEERNPNPSKMKHGIYSKNQIKYDRDERKYTRKPIESQPICIRCGYRCHSPFPVHKNYSHTRRGEIMRDETYGY